MELRIHAQAPPEVVYLGATWAEGLPWTTNKAAWERIFAAGVRHGLVLQDDLIMCQDFMAVVAATARFADAETAIGYFVKDPYLSGAPFVGPHWVEPSVLSGPAMLMRTDLAVRGVQWIESRSWPPPEGARDSHRWNRFFATHDVRRLSTRPQLLQHVGHDEAGGIGSIMNNPTQTTSFFAGEDARVVDLPWGTISPKTPVV